MRPRAATRCCATSSAPIAADAPQGAAEESVRKKVIFRGVALPYLLLLPQMAITLVFFFWPAGMAVREMKVLSGRQFDPAIMEVFCKIQSGESNKGHMAREIAEDLMQQ